MGRRLVLAWDDGSIKRLISQESTMAVFERPVGLSVSSHYKWELSEVQNKRVLRSRSGNVRGISSVSQGLNEQKASLLTGSRGSQVEAFPGLPQTQLTLVRLRHGQIC